MVLHEILGGYSEIKRVPVLERVSEQLAALLRHSNLIGVLSFQENIVPELSVKLRRLDVK